MFIKGKVTAIDVAHIIFTAITVGFYITMSSLNPETVFYYIYAGFAIFEAFVSFSYVYQIPLLMKLHFLFQSVLFVIPVFIFSVNLENLLWGSTFVLDTHHLDQIKVFVSSSGSTFCSSVFLLAWLLRILNTSGYFIRAEETHSSSKTKPVIFSTNVLNVTSMVLFIFLLFNVESLSLALPCIWLVFFEFLMTVLYAATQDDPESKTSFLRWIYQSVVFSVPCFLMVLLCVHGFYPSHVSQFLKSYNLIQFESFITRGPVFAVTTFFLFWVLRLFDTFSGLIEEYTKPPSN